MAASPEPRPEFSRLVPVDRLGEAEITREIPEDISAEPEERAALARRFGLLSLDRLSATFRLESAGRLESVGRLESAGRSERAGARNLVRIAGRLAAEVTQACVVTLEPVGARLEKDFTLLYDLDAAAAQGEAGGQAEGQREVVVEPEAEAEEPPEPVGPHGIDLGEAVAQQLAMALDPYPRAPGAALPEEPRAAAGPFAALEALKRGR